MFKVNNKNDVNDLVLVFFSLRWTYFTPFPSLSIVDFEQVRFSRVISEFVSGKLTANKYLLKGNNKNAIRYVQNMFKVIKTKTPELSNGVILVSLLSTSNIFQNFLYCFYFLLWAGRYFLS